MKRYKFYLLSIIIGVFCAGYLIYNGQVDQYDNSALAVAEVQLQDAQLQDYDNFFPHPDKTLYQMGLYLDINNKILYGSTILNTENTSGRSLEKLWFTAYPNAFKDSRSSPAPRKAYYEGFDAGWLEFSQIKVNGQISEYILDGVSVHVNLEEEILPEQAITVEMEWKAKIPKVAYRYGIKDNVFMLGNFYPSLNVLSDDWHNSYNSTFGDPFCLHAANYLVRINTPEAYEVVSTGKVVQTIAEDNGRQTHTIEAHNVRDFSLAILFNYQEINKVTSQANIKAYLPKDKEKMGKKFLQKSADMLNYFSCQFGSYPYEEFKIVFVPMEGFHGMEYSGLIFLRDEFLKPNYDLKHSEYILAHEIAHQWWYGLVGNDQLREPWLDEGLANWSAYKYFQDIKDRRHTPSPQTIAKGMNLTRELKDIYSTSEYYQIAYNGGEAFWFGLEKEIGTDKVFKALRSYLAEFKHKIATTHDLLEVIEAEANRNMDEYFDKWFDF